MMVSILRIYFVDTVLRKILGPYFTTRNSVQEQNPNQSIVRASIVRSYLKDTTSQQARDLKGEAENCQLSSMEMGNGH
jgi:hypothetical protein